MRLPLFFRLLIVLCAFAFVGFSPAEAEAKKMMLITHGETVKDRGELAPELAPAIQEATAPGTKMGYCYSYGGLFFIDFFVWDGYPCIYKKGEGTFADSEVWKLDEENLAEYAKYNPGQLTKPFLCKVPEGWVIALGALAVFGLLAFLGWDKEGEGGGQPSESSEGSAGPPEGDPDPS